VVEEGYLQRFAHVGVVFSVEDVQVPHLVDHLRGNYSALDNRKSQKPSILLNGLFRKLGTPAEIFTQFGLEGEPFLTIHIIKLPGLNKCCHFLLYLKYMNCRLKQLRHN
jgi:hypothetical protein